MMNCGQSCPEIRANVLVPTPERMAAKTPSHALWRRNAANSVKIASGGRRDCLESHPAQVFILISLSETPTGFLSHLPVPFRRPARSYRGHTHIIHYPHGIRFSPRHYEHLGLQHQALELPNGTFPLAENPSPARIKSYIRLLLDRIVSFIRLCRRPKTFVGM
jgi:hypothetical protein